MDAVVRFDEAHGVGVDTEADGVAAVGWLEQRAAFIAANDQLLCSSGGLNVCREDDLRGLRGSMDESDLEGGRVLSGGGVGVGGAGGIVGVVAAAIAEVVSSLPQADLDLACSQSFHLLLEGE